MTRTNGLAIIGGGPGGLAATKVVLSNHPGIERVHLFINDDNVGGVWYLPQNKTGRVMYDHLETNLPKELMQFSGFPFAPTVPEFPKRLDVFNYLSSYFQLFVQGDSRVIIHWNTDVVSVSKENNKWIIYTDKGEDPLTFDHIISATGHFKIPYIPKHIEGLDHWVNDGRAIHAKDFQNSEFARDKNVIIVGNGSSGQDIVNQVSSVAKHVYHSITDLQAKSPIYIDDPIISTVPTITETILQNNHVHLSDGKSIHDVDLIILATGYYYDFTIFDKNIRHDLVGNPNGLGQNVSNLWGHIFWERDPTLSFILIPLGVVPFPLAELQASLIVKQIIGQLDISKIDDSKFKDSVKLEPGKDVEYSKFLQRVLDTTQTDKERDPFQPVRWDVRLTDLRMQCPKLKEQRNIQLHKLTLSFRQQGESYRI